MREVKFEVLSDPSIFTPLQLQPRFLMSVAFNAWSRWSQQHFVPFTRMIRQYKYGLVVVGGHFEYLEPVGFLEAESGEVRARARARLGGAFLQLEFSATAAGKRVVRGTAILMPVKIDELHTLSATPARLSDELLALMESDEVDLQAPQRPVQALLRQLEGGSPSLMTATYPFVVYRHACEMADQWCAAQIPCYVSEARESLSLARGDHDAKLRRCLTRPLRFFNMELTRPMYIFDKGSVVTSVHDIDGQYAFIHRLVSADQEHGIVIERF
jgi:acyl-CoA thioesterase FadM